MPYPVHSNHREHQKRAVEKIKKDPVRVQQYKDIYRRQSLQYKFGITVEQYNELLEAQNHKCGICKKSIEDEMRVRRFAVDHCHTTGKIRGLLCKACNTGLGNFSDDIDTLVSAIAWLSNRS